jgi:hypothetical protein
MKSRIFLSSATIFLLALLSFAQTFQTGKIVSITRHPATAPNKSSTDAPSKSASDDYDVVISVGGTNYTSLYRHHGDLEPAWSEGKDIEVQISGKVMNVKKANGKTEKLKIVSSKPA